MTKEAMREEFYKAFPKFAGILEMVDSKSIDALDSMEARHKFVVFKTAWHARDAELQALKDELADAHHTLSLLLDELAGLRKVDAELAKYKNAEPVAVLTVKQGRGPRKSSIVFCGENSPDVGTYKLFTHPEGETK